MGAEKFGMPLETREIKLFWRDIPGFCRDIPEVPEKFDKRKFVFNFRSLSIAVTVMVIAKHSKNLKCSYCSWDGIVHRRERNVNINFSGWIAGVRTPGKEP